MTGIQRDPWAKGWVGSRVHLGIPFSVRIIRSHRYKVILGSRKETLGCKCTSGFFDCKRKFISVWCMMPTITRFFTLAVSNSNDLLEHQILHKLGCAYQNTDILEPICFRRRQKDIWYMYNNPRPMCSSASCEHSVAIIPWCSGYISKTRITSMLPTSSNQQCPYPVHRHIRWNGSTIS